MNNYTEINTIAELTKTLRSLLDEGDDKYLAALFIALTLPDSLGKVAYPDMPPGRRRYIKWFDGHVADAFGMLYSDSFFEHSIRLRGKECYQLRCKLLHENTNDISDQTGINEFVLCFNDQRVLTGHISGTEPRFDLWRQGMEAVPQNVYLYVGVKALCTDILNAAETFMENNPKADYPKLRMNRGGGKIPAGFFFGEYNNKKR